jgi:phage FluMu protein Com
MQTLSERAEINRFLKRHGFGELGDAGLLPQLAYAIDNEKTLMRVLNLAVPEERTECYESLRPLLRFVPRPLDVLLSEIAMDAEIRQLPVIQPDGSFKPYSTPEVQEAVARAAATGTLEMVCDRCTKSEHIPAISRAFAVELARERGWTETGGIVRCPECSKLLKVAETAPKAAGAALDGID